MDKIMDMSMEAQPINRNEDGTIKQGAVLNPNGRPKGSKNKISQDTKKKIEDIVSSELELLPTHLKELTERERIDALIKLLPYIIPKQTELITEDTENTLTITIQTDEK